MDDRTPRVFTLLYGFLRVLAALLVSLVVVPPVAGAVGVATLLKAPLPTGDLPEERPRIKAVPSQVVDVDGNEIAVFRSFDRTVEFTADEIPEVLKNASVAIEDRRFWEHGGVDFEGIARAMRVNLESGGVAQGGSTITQQYVKNVYLSQEKTIERKVSEALLAIELEEKLTKEEILFGYLTTSYYGEGAYGVGAAAEVYFNKPLTELDISEAATLAGLVQAPSRLSPRQNLDLAEARRLLVLDAMVEQGYITPEDHERESARQLWFPENGPKPSESVTVLAPRLPNGATDHHFFVDFVEADLLERLGPDTLYQGGLKIETTIDPTLQAQAEASVAERLEGTERPIEMSMVSIDPATGHVKAMVGGRDYHTSQVNLATGGVTGFQPGSSFKPIVMAAAFELGLSPDSIYPAPAQWTVPDCTGECSISNYDHANRGDITIRDAMRLSVNTVFGQMILDTSIDETAELARKLGLDRLGPDRHYGVSLALGASESSPLEMASAYSTFANRGVRAPATGILRVIDDDGNVLIDNRNPAGERVLSEVTADNVTDVLRDVIEAGTGKQAQIGRPAAGKTGTAQNYTAAWFVGYTPQLSTAVWMGHSDSLQSLRNVNGVGRVTGGSHPAVAWSDFMAVAHEGIEPVEFIEPAEIVPIAETVEEVVQLKRKADPTPNRQSRVDVLAANCGGRSCRSAGVSKPALPPPEVPAPIIVQAPPTTLPPPASAPTSPLTPTPTPVQTPAPAPTVLENQ